LSETNIQNRSKEPNSKLRIIFIFHIYLAPNVIVRTTICTATISLGLPKITKPCIYYLRYISPWCTLFCEQKLYIASDCSVPGAPTTKTAEKGSKNSGRKHKKPGTLHNVEQGTRGIKEPPVA
jgi:hypothetical protein